MGFFGNKKKLSSGSFAGNVKVRSARKEGDRVVIEVEAGSIVVPAADLEDVPPSGAEVRVELAQDAVEAFMAGRQVEGNVRSVKQAEATAAAVRKRD